MKIQFSKLKKIPVHTESDTYVGHITDVVLTTDNHSIKTYFVRKNVLQQPLAVDVTQVRAITATKIVIADTLIKVTTVAEKVGSVVSKTASVLEKEQIER